MVKILVLGSNGFIGKSLCHCFENSSLLQAKVYKADSSFSYGSYHTDCSVEDEIYRLLCEIEPDVIINSAAIVGVEKVKTYPLETIKNNFEISYNLCDALCKFHKENYNPLIIFFSSSEVYGNTINASVKNNTYELFPYEKRSSYSLTKLLEENMYNNIRNLYTNIKILRLFSIVGEEQSSFFVIPKMIENIIFNKTVTITPTYRCFCYIDFLTSSLEKLIYFHEKEGKDFYPQVTNFTSFLSENYVSMFDLYRCCCSVIGKEVPYVLKNVDNSDIIYRKSETPQIPIKYLDRRKDISLSEIVRRIYEFK